MLNILAYAFLPYCLSWGACADSLSVFNWVVSVLLSFKSSLHTLDYHPLSVMSFANIFFQCGFSSHSLERVFCTVEVFNLKKISLSIVTFMDCAFGILSKSSSSFFSPMLSSRIYVILHFYIEVCVIYFELFYEGYKVCVYSHFLACGYQVVLAPFVEKIIFSPLF